MHTLDLTGYRFGKLVALRKEEGSKYSSWRVHCDCGTEKVVSVSSLRNGSTVSCGCHRKQALDSSRYGKSRHLDLSGKRFGKWAVIQYFGADKCGAWWICKCDCGMEKPVMTKSLTSGASQSCGCFRVEKSKKAFGWASETGLYHRYRHNCAKKRGYMWRLTREEFSKLIYLPCHYCGSSPSNTYKAEHGNGACIYNGLDRVDNSVGYILSNVVPSCFICQRAKMAMSYHEFLKYLDVVTKFRLTK